MQKIKIRNLSFMGLGMEMVFGILPQVYPDTPIWILKLLLWVGIILIFSYPIKILCEFFSKKWLLISANRLLFIITLTIGLVFGSLVTGLYYKQYSDRIEFKNITIEKEQEQAKLQMFATPDELIASHLKGKTIRIVDLAREDNIIRKRTFEDCYIYGPAFIVPLGRTAFINSSIEGLIDDVIITIPKSRGLIGCIGCLDCTFIRCDFRKIGFIGSPKLKENFKKGSKEVK